MGLALPAAYSDIIVPSCFCVSPFHNLSPSLAFQLLKDDGFGSETTG